MKKKIGAMLILILMLSTILIGNNTVLNVTENKDNRVNKDAMFISKSYLLGLSTKNTVDINDILPTSSPDNVLLNKNPIPSTTKKVKMANKKSLKAKHSTKIKSDEKLNGTNKPVAKRVTKQVTRKVTSKVAKKATKPVARKVNRKATKKTHSYTQQDLYILTHIIHGESSGQSWNFQVAVGSVVLNRVKSNKFPNTIKGVVFQKGQYASTWDGNYNKTPSNQSKRVAKYLLENGSQLPSHIIFQAEFKQGRGVYKKMGNTYFCY